ncbi:MAG: diacylglycerol kinase [Gammaproteobacteria bacterium]|nr:MAG: diacylglycerol kinase [Gammaproteobacteria bacterium]
MIKPIADETRRLAAATHFSLAGLRSTYRNEPAFRQEVICCLIALPLAWWIADDALDYALLVGSSLLVLIVELLNSAIEAVVDRIGEDYHELSGRAKDAGSAAVLMTIVMALLVWIGVAAT